MIILSLVEDGNFLRECPSALQNTDFALLRNLRASKHVTAYFAGIIILGSHKTISGNTIMIAKQIIIIATKGTIDL